MKINPQNFFVLGSSKTIPVELFNLSKNENDLLFPEYEYLYLSSNSDVFAGVLTISPNQRLYIDFLNSNDKEDLKKLLNYEYPSIGIYLIDDFKWKKKRPDDLINFSVVVNPQEITYGQAKKILERIKDIVNSGEHCKYRYWGLFETHLSKLAHPLIPSYFNERVFNLELQELRN